MVKAYQNQPVKFLAVLANVPLPVAAAYQAQTRLAMPIYPDSLGLMQKRYGFKISLKNIWQFRLIDPNGKIISYQMTQEAIDKALAETKPKWKYKDEKYDAKLGPLLDLFEDGQHTIAMKKLRSLRTSSNKSLAESANKLFKVLQDEGSQWKQEADSAADDPVKAYDLYSRVASVFAGTDLGKSAAEPLKKLSTQKTVTTELAARKAFGALKANFARLTSAQKSLLVKPCQDIVKKYPNTPTSNQVAELLKELE